VVGQRHVGELVANIEVQGHVSTLSHEAPFDLDRTNLDIVNQPERKVEVGPGSSTRAGKIAAAVFLVVCLSAMGLVVWIQGWFRFDNIELVKVSEALGPDDGTSCHWIVDIELARHDHKARPIFVRIPVIGAPPSEQRTRLRMGQGGNFPSQIVTDLSPCPTSLDDIEHEDLEITYMYADDRTPSLKFIPID
jgi:hypothetical protein